MNRITTRHTILSGLLGIASILTPVVGHAELHSRSKELVVLEPHDLPEQARIPGCSLFLHADDAGSTYLYIEQQQGTRLTVLDVTDPAHISVASSTMLGAPGVFDFVQSLNDRAELIRFHGDNGAGVLDLRHARRPTLRVLPTSLAAVEPLETLGEGGLLAVNEPHNPAVAESRDYQVIDVSKSSDPTLLTTVKQVDHSVVKGDTGTTFLLGTDGLTVIRRIPVENDYRLHLAQTQGN